MNAKPMDPKAKPVPEHAHPDPVATGASTAHPHAFAVSQLRPLLDQWERLTTKAPTLLRQGAYDNDWLCQVQAFAGAVRQVMQQDADVALFVALQSNALSVDHYSENHAVTCLVLGELAALWMEWTEHERDTLAWAALTMNVSMTTLQDTLAEQSHALSANQRQRIDTHAEQSVQLLRNAGVQDALWLEVVGQHHTAQKPLASSEADPVPRLAELLRRVDVYTAKLSRRANRDSVTPAKAARDACLGPDGHPDHIGATLLRVAGLYPPGTYVELANGETAVVIRRGEKAHTPSVASVRAANWALISPPQFRDTSRPIFAVRRGVDPSQVRVNFDSLHLLCCS